MKLTEGCDVMNLSEAKTLYKKCDCNGLYIYTEYGEEVSREFRALVTDKLLRKWEKERFIELYDNIKQNKGDWWDFNLMCEMSEEWRKGPDLQMLSSAVSKLKYADICEKLCVAEIIIGSDKNNKYWWKSGLIWNAVRIGKRKIGCKLAYQALELLHTKGICDEKTRKRCLHDLKRCKCIMRLLFIR